MRRPTMSVSSSGHPCGTVGGSGGDGGDGGGNGGGNGGGSYEHSVQPAQDLLIQVHLSEYGQVLAAHQAAHGAAGDGGDGGGGDGLSPSQ